MSRRRLRATIWIIAILLSPSGCGTVEPVQTAVVEGREYALAVVRGIVIDAGDLTPYATIERATDPTLFLDDTTYALRDVDPTTFLAIRLKPGLRDDAGAWGEYLGLLGGGQDEDLCPYFNRLAPTWCEPLPVETWVP